MNAESFPIHREISGPFAGVVMFRLEQPGKPVVVLDHDLFRRLEATLKALPRDATGLVIASASERVFVAGADLKSISDLDNAALDNYLAYGSAVFGMIAELPYPTAAAINGAALGGGLELAMHCDGLIASPPASKDGQPGRPYPVGLPEAGLAICPGWGGTNLLPARMQPMEAIRRTASGQTMAFDEAVSARLFDRVAASAGELISTAQAWVMEQRPRGRGERNGAPWRWIGRGPVAANVLAALDEVRGDLPTTAAASAVADAVDVGLARGWMAALECERRHLIRLRHTPEARAALEAFFSKSKR
ncbi:MAG: enoyl-CoA hydratase/isomerase family protein [Phycisphaerales bacterium]